MSSLKSEPTQSLNDPRRKQKTSEKEPYSLKSNATQITFYNLKKVTS
jgi:hypothetical protein